MKILSFGEILWDVYDTSAVIGGAPFNFAGHCAKHGEQVYMLSAIGKDELGASALEKVESIGVKTDYISKVSAPTGRCLVTLNEKGVPCYNLLDNVAYDYISGKVESGFDLLYFGTLSLRNKNNRDYLAALISENSFKEIFCDVNIRPPYYNKQSVEFCFSNATIIKVSDEELQTVTDILFGEALSYKAAAQKMARKYENIKAVIITRGEKGAYLYLSGSKTEYEVAAPEVCVASTVGAGDSFSAAFTCKYLAGESIEECLNHAAKVSAFVVTELAAIPDYPDNF